MNLVDGKAIAAGIRQEVANQVKTNGLQLSLGIVACAPNLETTTYLSLKQRIAHSLGIALKTEILPENATTEDVLAAVLRATTEHTGVVVQLPLPAHIDTARVLGSIPSAQDVDVFHYQGEQTDILPPVIGAVAEIASLYQVPFAGQKVVIFGSGKLVGLPARHFALAAGAEVAVITPNTPEALVLEKTQAADIIILGVGKPNLLTKEMVRPGVVVFDAGASEDGGLLVGDAQPEVALTARLFTPVPGGIGPITVALLFRNLLRLTL